ncbi:UDP-glucose 4-epimerase GalE [Candidatus Saccharibacteria bacterium]|nr:UDP-glucose 4-epimerase GalE [Candidatus Saccharibacteria bacterium]MBQ9017380.1 UDP-glucose 4-epimerase GalE [Candidatus Saccharibacteria bacterium]
MKILVTGGTGYIGSHTAVELIQAGYEVEILDNLYNSKESVLDKIAEITGTRPVFHKVDLLDFPGTLEVLRRGFDAVIHFAGLKAVAESVEKPILYYENNIGGTLNLLKAMRETGCRSLIFSSSATVYGDQGVARLDETMETGRGITNPYGQTKFMIEQILRDVCAADSDFSAVLLRYFNPVGAHASGLLGEDPNGIPNNLMPIVMKVSTGEIPELSVYGDDYPTPDGTCIRDYIHVVDLAKGHLAALAKLQPGCTVYNLGSGRGTSVLEMVKAFEKASGAALPYKIVGRRAGDLAELIAVPDKALSELGWKTELSIDDAMSDTLRFLGKNH